MTLEEILKFNESLERCYEESPFLITFHKNFLSSAPEIQNSFNHLPVKRQIDLLESSLSIIVLGADGNLESKTHLENLHALHVKRGITTSMFELWKTALIETVRNCDPGWTALTEQIWNQILDAGMEAILAPSRN